MSSTVAHSLAPSAAGQHTTSNWPHGVKMETYDSASPEIKALIRQLNRLAQAETLEEHQVALQGFDEDVIFDTPFIQLQGRERLRVLSSLVKTFLGRFEIEPRLVTITVPEGPAAKGGKLDIEGIVHWLPHRVWYLPFTLLFPKDLPIFANVSLGIKSHNDKVFFVSGKNHNLPHVARILRVVAGWVAGMAVSIVEPAVMNVIDMYRAAMDQATGTTVSARSTATSAIETVKGTAGSIIEGTKERVGDVADAAKNVASKVVGTVTGSGTTATSTTTTVPSTTSYTSAVA